MAKTIDKQMESALRGSFISKGLSINLRMVKIANIMLEHNLASLEEIKKLIANLAGIYNGMRADNVSRKRLRALFLADGWSTPHGIDYALGLLKDGRPVFFDGFACMTKREMWLVARPIVYKRNASHCIACWDKAHDGAVLKAFAIFNAETESAGEDKE